MVGTRKAMPVSLPLSSGSTAPTALAAPVEEGMMLVAALKFFVIVFCFSFECFFLVFFCLLRGRTLCFFAFASLAHARSLLLSLEGHNNFSLFQKSKKQKSSTHRAPSAPVLCRRAIDRLLRRRGGVDLLIVFLKGREERRKVKK